MEQVKVPSFQDKSKDSKANPLSVKNIGGVFVVLLCGLSLAIIVAVLEFCWNSRKNAQSDHQVSLHNDLSSTSTKGRGDLF